LRYRNVEVSVMLRFFSVLAASALMAGAAAADDPRSAPGGAERLSELMDVNRDGVISREEFKRHNVDRARWQALDSDGDGALDAAEQAAGVTPGPRIVR
jgi:hypothetical protein